MERYQLGGRDFVHVGESTVEHDFHFMELVHAAGLDDIELAPGETGEAFAERILREVVGTGQALPLLGCLLIPEPSGVQARSFGELWTPEMGKETAKFLGGLTSEEDKGKIRSLVISMLIDFFESGLSSLRTSATSSQSGAGPTQDSVGAMATGAS